MALLIDINDLAIRCYHKGHCLAQAPGYALVDKKSLTIGDQAHAQARLNPLMLHNDFWQRLNTAPLDSQHARARHNADLAHTQLQRLLQALPDEHQQAPLIFCLPSSWETAELSLFLGLAKTFQHPVIGLVDSAVAALANHPHSHQQLYIEWHLHEVVISHVKQTGHDLQRHRVETLAGQGWYNLQEHLLRSIAQLFIQKLRFDPRHSATTEQSLFNQLPQWLNMACQGREQELTLDEQRISISAEELLEHVRSFLSPLFQRLQQAEQDEQLQQLVFSDRFSPIAPLLKRFQKSALVQEHALAHSFDDLADQLQQHPDGTHYLMQLPAKQASTTPASRINVQQLQLLCGHHAYPLSAVEHWTTSAKDHGISKGGRTSETSIAVFDNGQITPGAIGHLTVNGQPIKQSTRLLPGDQISCDQRQERLSVIQLQHPAGDDC